MKKSSKNIAAECCELLTPTIEDLGYEVWDVEFVKEGTEWYLRITIDHEDGIDIDDCERVHRAIDPVLDEADPIEQAYHLEVSSPGIERELRTDAHLDAFLGEEVEVRLYAPKNGQKAFRGLLAENRENSILLSLDGASVEIAKSDAAKIQTVFDFSEI